MRVILHMAGEKSGIASKPFGPVLIPGFAIDTSVVGQFQLLLPGQSRFGIQHEAVKKRRLECLEQIR